MLATHALSKLFELGYYAPVEKHVPNSYDDATDYLRINLRCYLNLFADHLLEPCANQIELFGLQFYRGRYIRNGDTTIFQHQRMKHFNDLRQLMQPIALKQKQQEIAHRLLIFAGDHRSQRGLLRLRRYRWMLEEFFGLRIPQHRGQLSEFALPLIEPVMLLGHIESCLRVAFGGSAYGHPQSSFGPALSLEPTFTTRLSKCLFNQASLLTTIKLFAHDLRRRGDRQVSNLLTKLLPRLLALSLDGNPSFLNDPIGLDLSLVFRSCERLLRVLARGSEQFLRIAARLAENLFVARLRRRELLLHSLGSSHALFDAIAPLVDQVGDRPERIFPEDSNKDEERNQLGN
jgi:hypothetical protein